MTPAALAARAVAAPARPPRRRRHDGDDRRPTAPLDALESFPALAASRDRLLHGLGQERVSTDELVAAIESDVALVIAVLRLANQVAGTSGRVESIVQAVKLLSPAAVHSIATRAQTFDFFEPDAMWQAAPERFRLHAVATQQAADRLATETGYANRDRLLVTALLHDIGKLALMHARPERPDLLHGQARTPRERIERERHQLGIDHATVGAKIARRWGLPDSVASTIERHHDAGARNDDAAYIQLADMLAHHAHGATASPNELLERARAIGLGPAALRTVVYELPNPHNARPRVIGPCPLSERELEVIEGLAKGKVYKQIALELSLSVSTVRTHLHKSYRKLGVIDRAQAVILATERGWLD